MRGDVGGSPWISAARSVRPRAPRGGHLDKVQIVGDRGTDAVVNDASSGSADGDIQVEEWIAARIPNWSDVGWWQAQIAAATDGHDPILSNLRITLAHLQLSLALHRITGEGSGANFHTWAVWGSKKAGQTIREQDVPLLARAGVGAGTVTAASAAAVLSGGGRYRRVAASAAAGAASGAAVMWTTKRALDRAAADIFGGNVTVLADIGAQTARFVSTFLAPGERTEERLAGFLEALRPGRARDDGQDLLRGAYSHYFHASRERDRDRRDELMLCANLFAILHEHQRLQPYIDASVPRPLRRFVTEHLLSFTVGAEAMRVSRDVPSPGPSPFPDTLRTIQTPELESFLCGPEGWDRTPDTLSGSAARDWTKLSDRMNYIVDLFRSRQADENLFSAPFTPEQRDLILSGRVPPGPL